MFLICLNSFAQIKDTIFLKEIEIKVEKTSKIIKHLKTKGTNSAMSGNSIKSIISRIDKIPSGSLSSIKFYFNSKFFDENKRKEYKDVEMGLLIYEVNEDGSLGSEIVDKEIRFILKAGHRGCIELDLTPLYLNTSESMYFGIELFKQQSGNDFKIMTKKNNESPNSLYVKYWDNNDWLLSNFGNTFFKIKIDLDVKLNR
jgi:hypothetical protein